MGTLVSSDVSTEARGESFEGEKDDFRLLRSSDMRNAARDDRGLASLESGIWFRDSLEGNTVVLSTSFLEPNFIVRSFPKLFSALEGRLDLDDAMLGGFTFASRLPVCVSSDDSPGACLARSSIGRLIRARKFGMRGQERCC